MNIKKLPRAPMRPEDEPGYEKEIWQPSWKCFCCHDTGIITPHLAAMVIDGYNRNSDKLPRCVNPGCSSGDHWDSEALTNCVDYRINAATCQQLDALEREDWRQTLRLWQINIQALARHTSLRKRDCAERTAVGNRTVIEEIEAQQQHSKVCNADPSKLKAIAQIYLESDYIKNGKEVNIQQAAAHYRLEVKEL